MGGEGEKDAEVRVAARAAVQSVRPVAFGLPQVWDLPDLFSQPRVERHDPGREEGELVRDVFLDSGWSASAGDDVANQLKVRIHVE
jgi:hypothetical protein